MTPCPGRIFREESIETTPTPPKYVKNRVLNKLGLGCNAPIAVNVNVTDNVVKLKLMIFSITKMKHISINLEKDVAEIGLLVDEVLSKLNKMDFKKILNE